MTQLKEILINTEKWRSHGLQHSAKTRPEGFPSTYVLSTNWSKTNPSYASRWKNRFQEQYDVKLTSWFISHGRNEYDDPKLHVRIDKFSAVDTILKGNIKVANKILNCLDQQCQQGDNPPSPVSTRNCVPGRCIPRQRDLSGDAITSSYGMRGNYDPVGIADRHS